MKYTIFGFNQELLVEYGLDVIDALILEYIVKFRDSGRMVHIQANEKSYFWLKYSALLEDIPIARIKSKDVLRRRLRKMVASGVLEHYTHKAQGTFSYYRLNQAKYEPLIRKIAGGATLKSEGCNFKVGGGATLKSEQKTSLLKDQSTKDTLDESNPKPSKPSSPSGEVPPQPEPEDAPQATTSPLPSPLPSSPPDRQPEPIEQPHSGLSASQSADRWNVIAKAFGLAVVRGITGNRLKHLEARVKSAPDFWAVVGLECGRLAGWAKGEMTNQRRWTIDFDYIVHSDGNFNKLAEGKFREPEKPKAQVAHVDTTKQWT